MLLMVKVMANGDMCMIDNGHTRIYDKTGILKNEDAGLIPQYTTGALDMPVVSVLSSSAGVEVALFNYGCDMRRFTTELDSMSCVMKLQMLRKYIRMLKNSGEEGRVKFNQMIFVYPDDMDIGFVINELSLEEIV